MKHREFWITMHRNEHDVLLPLHAFLSSNKAFNERAEETILVIDRRAYEELEAENARLKEALEDQGKLVRRLSKMFKEESKETK